jgi:hypothetical protein
MKLSPGLIVLLYCQCWDLEKVFDQFKANSTENQPDRAHKKTIGSLPAAAWPPYEKRACLGRDTLFGKA